MRLVLRFWPELEWRNPGPGRAPEAAEFYQRLPCRPGPGV